MALPSLLSLAWSNFFQNRASASASHCTFTSANRFFSPDFSAARSFSRLLSGAVADLSYLADPGGP